jgi:hypothetical protein
MNRKRCMVRHSIPENPVIAYAIRSGDSFILHHKLCWLVIKKQNE